MKIGIAAFVVATLLTTTAAAGAEYSHLVPAQSHIAFVSRQMGAPVDGRFRSFNLQLAFDPGRPAAAKAVIDIDVASVDAGSAEANEEVVGRNWFNARQFPRARFESSALRALGGNRYEVRGRMTLKGQSREMSVPFTFTPSGRAGIIDGGFVLKRLEWGIGQGAWGDPDTVADEVQVTFRFTVEPGKAAARP